MGSSRKSKSTRDPSVRPGKRRARQPHSGLSGRSSAEVPEIPEGLREEIEDQRDVLGTVMTLLHCLHVVLTSQLDDSPEELSAGALAATGWVHLPDITVLLLERTHAVHLALDAACLTKALRP